MFATEQTGPLDAAIAQMLPINAVPLEGTFSPLAGAGRRLLVARDGIYVEAANDALYVRLRLVALHTPYGELTEGVALRGAPMPRAFARTLMERSLASHPCEMAALIVADAGEPAGYRLIEPEGQGHVGQVTYADHGYDDAKLVIDAHSHGPFPSIFSHTDNASDRSRGGPHLSVVFGHCGERASTTVAIRACVGNYLIPLDETHFSELFA
jgi:PRTRC system protein A